MPMIEGKSAYQIAVANGFVGTEAEWLESLKGAGEIADHTAQLNYLNNVVINGSGASHNASYYANYLGSQITAAQLASIKNGSFTDIYPGTRWNFKVLDSLTLIAVVMGCNLLKNKGWNDSNTDKNHVILQIIGYQAQVNDTDDCSGGFANTKLHNETFPELLELLYNYIPSECFIGIQENISDAVNNVGTVEHLVASVEKMLLPSPFNMWGYTDHREFYRFANRVRWPYTFYYPEYCRWEIFPLNCTVNHEHWGYTEWHGQSGVIGIAATQKNPIMPYVIIGPQD